MFGLVKRNRSFLKLYFQELEKVHTDFRIVARAHNFLEVAGIHQLLSAFSAAIQKTDGEKETLFLRLFYVRGLSDKLLFVLVYKL